MWGYTDLAKFDAGLPMNGPGLMQAAQEQDQYNAIQASLDLMTNAIRRQLGQLPTDLLYGFIGGAVAEGVGGLVRGVGALIGEIKAARAATGAARAGGELTADGAAGAAAPGARDLGVDPATGAFRPGEYQTALRIQRERGVVLSRSSDPGVDWVDADGNTYDAVGNFSAKHFDQQWPNLQSRILDHMTKADYVPVDVSGFTPRQIEQVQQFIGPLGPSVFIVGP